MTHRLNKSRNNPTEGIPTPRPTPQFFRQVQTFSTKKQRGTPKDAAPPRPPVKSAPPISRIFQHKPIQKAVPVSFKESETSVLSPFYNEHNNELYFDQCFQIERKLGAGSFGEVFQVVSKEDGKRYAVKRSRERFRGGTDRKRKLEEVAKHERLPRHPNCVHLVKAWEEKQHLYIQTELCDTSLENYSENNHNIPERLVWNYLVDLLMAVEHLHNHDLVHLDIKPDNIFITKDGVCKLGDFGLMIDISKETEVADCMEGDPKYMAPELLQGKFGKQADIFSVGMTILEIASDLDLPKSGDAWHRLRSGSLPEELLQDKSRDLRRVIRHMIEPGHYRRPTAKQLLELPFVKKVWKRRKREQFKQHIVSYFAKIWHSIVLMMLAVWSCITYPLRAFTKPSIQTPPKIHVPRHNSYWDQSFSDDDAFEADESVNLANNSMVSPLDLSSSMDELDNSRNGSFAVPTSIAPRKAKTTPMMRSRKIITPRSSSPILSLANMDHFKPNTSLRSENSMTPDGSSHSTQSDASSEDLVKLGIEPKNLLNAFESASDDEL
ncbi:unnamed protein product [Owenia fusiformis]|uniref:Membrane-associated tyrosine- and threonine-specific cdc2-inhibitory kinase n=1 Tax=Owenia fusiformis TaxID=6347 RepID=A0A8J1XW73_OWEFU|nr:unnamed protein product [Owenia fusiformis]